MEDVDLAQVISEANPEGSSLPKTLLRYDEENRGLNVGGSLLCRLG